MKTIMPSIAGLLLTAFSVLPGTAQAAAGPLKVLTTVAPLTNIIANVGGEHIHVTGIVPEGVNSHTFEPAPSDARVLSEADVIIVNGLHLEIPTVKLAEKVKDPATPIIKLGNNTIRKQDWRYDFSFPREHGHPNPHLWPNVALAMRYAEITRDVLAELDPRHKDAYYANTTAYLARLSKLDAAIFDCVKSIPAQNRKLVTYHDSYAYFAPRYGMRVIGAIQPADFTEPRPRDVMQIIRQLKEERVPAVFGSEVFPSKVLEQIARESGAEFIDELADDDLPGEPGDPTHTFIGMMVSNMQVMTRALGGDPGCVAHIDATDI